MTAEAHPGWSGKQPAGHNFARLEMLQVGTMLELRSIIDADELVAFDAVAKARSFSVAAVEVGCSQSTISQRIARLEKRLKSKLVNRTTRQVSLTADGEAMLVYARSILTLAEEARVQLAQSIARAARKPGPDDAPPADAPPDAVAVLRMLETQLPDFRLKLGAERHELVRHVLHADAADMILGESHAPDENGALWQERLVWVAHPSLQLQPSDVVPLISQVKPSLTRILTEQALRSQGRAWRNVAECSSLFGVLAAVCSGLGVAAIEQRFKKLSFEGMLVSADLPPLVEPAEAGLPPLGKLSYGIGPGAS